MFPGFFSIPRELRKTGKHKNHYWQTADERTKAGGHTNMLDKNFYYYAKSIYEKAPKSNEEWIKQFDNSKAVQRYASLQGIGEETQLSSNGIVPNNVKTEILKKDKAAYLSIHSFNTFNIDGDMKIIKPYLQSINNYKTLIIDIRGNGGGNSRYWSDNLVPMLINKPANDTQYLAFRGGGFVEQFIKCRFGFGYEKLEPISDIYKESLKNLPTEMVSVLTRQSAYCQTAAMFSGSHWIWDLPQMGAAILNTRRNLI